ncbi:MAG: TfoX/Sxy family protein [Polyangiales bacterium]
MFSIGVMVPLHRILINHETNWGIFFAMPYDEKLAERVRQSLKTRRGVEEKKMFGGIAFMVRGHMTVGVMDNDLMVRVGKDDYDEALKMPGARPMDFTGRPLKTMIFVGKRSVSKDDALKLWVDRALTFNKTLPAK